MGMLARGWRLLRPNAQSVDGPGTDAALVPVAGDTLWDVATSPVNRRAATPVTYFHGDLPGPISLERAVWVDPVDGAPNVTTNNYGRAAHGVGLFDVEPIIPAGEVD